MVDNPDTQKPEGNGKQDSAPQTKKHDACRIRYCRVAYNFLKCVWICVDRSANPILAIATIILAIVAGAALRDAKVTTVVSQRAYIYANPGNIYNIGTPNKIEARFWVGNSGNTFAKNVRRSATIMTHAPLRPDEIAGLGPGQSEEGIFNLNPRVKVEMNRRMIDTTTDPSEFQTDQKRVYIFGRIQYEDVFGSPHFTNFCFMFFGEMMPQGNNVSYIARQHKYCEGHNDSD